MSESTTNTYWKSLNELAKNKEYQKFVDREFPENATELKDGVSRRGFLRVMGASIALAGFAACRRPVQKILPYSRQPEDVVAGKPLFYASAMPFRGNLQGIVVENHQGRPTKIEGNELHPASKGGTSVFQQAAILGMYDPDRSRNVLNNGEVSSVSDFEWEIYSRLEDKNRNILFISEANSSPTFASLKQKALSAFKNARWATYEPFGEENVLAGVELAFGKKLRPYLRLERADVIIAINDDLMGAVHPNQVDYAKQITSRRKVASQSSKMNRLYVVEDSFSVTGSYADHRLRLKASQTPAFVMALAAELSKNIGGLQSFSGYTNEFSGHKWISVLAEELRTNPANSVLTVGSDFAPGVHATVAAINLAVKNAGTTIAYYELPFAATASDISFVEAAKSLSAGTFDTVFIIGTNPVLTAPSDLNFAEALKKAEVVVHLSDYVDETSALANWHVNRAHFLEAWGDGYSFTGARSVVQPQIQPLFGGISEIEFLNLLLTGSVQSGHELVKETWASFYRTGFDKKWKEILHDGLDKDTTFKTSGFSISRSFVPAITSYVSALTSIDGIEVVIRPDNSVYDGRFANNSWLQELPDPMTKITWDNVALMSVKTAAALGVENEDVISVSVNNKSIEIPVWVQPGHAEESITLATGYGRKTGGRVAGNPDVQAVDVFPMRTTTSGFYSKPGSISKTGKKYAIACVQDHHSLEGRDVYREGTLAQYASDADFASFKSIHTYEVPGLKEGLAKGDANPISLFDPQTFPEHEPQWGMAIDLNACFGCGVCVIACQSENNIPVIGKREVNRGREMHWIRNDRYFVGDTDEPRAVHQPMPCMHCEMAPCEQVCPVAATTHSEDGMNQMTYNRCIGTRYCANNCPYKVRRFNFFNYPKEFLATGSEPEIVQMAMNPDVTVRFRGVMEKCTYCVQRVNRAKIDTKIKTGSPKPADGTVKTACQQACPADAIYFGDLTDKNSAVSLAKANDRNYLVLEELNTRPRTSYMAKLRNPNPALA